MDNKRKYGGSWKIFDDESIFQGELHIDYEKRMIALELILPASEDKPMPRAPYKGKIPFICGTLFSGAKILLYDCQTGQERRNLDQFTQQVIYANYAFWGLYATSINDVKFPKVVVDFGNIIEWSDLCKYEWRFNDNGGTDLLWSHKSSVEIELRDNLHVSFNPRQGSIGGDMLGIEISANQHIEVEFQYNQPVPWETILEDVLNIQYLIGVGVNQKVNFNSIKYCHDSIKYCHDSKFIELRVSTDKVSNYYEPLSVIIGVGESHLIQTNNAHQYLYTLPQFINNNALKKWCENYDVLKPILDLYFTASSGVATTAEILFLNLTQALETYHARLITNNAKTYPDRVAKLVNSFVPNGHNTQKWTDYLLDENQKKIKNKINLRSRLADLTFADGVLPFLPEHKLPPTEYIRKVVDTRNYYTHYDPKKLKKAFTKEQLPWVNDHLLALLEYHLLVLLGFDSNEVRTRTVKKINNINDIYYIQSGTHKIIQ